LPLQGEDGQAYKVAVIREKLTEIRRFITAVIARTPPCSPRAGGSGNRSGVHVVGDHVERGFHGVELGVQVVLTLERQR
jgi:tetrahydromethanopterin S-methyltransferase subunit B